MERSPMEEIYEIVYDWNATESEEDLELVSGSDIIVVEKYSHGWWFGRTVEVGKNGRQGFFPSNYVRAKMGPNPPPTPPRPASFMQISEDIIAINEQLATLSNISYDSVKGGCRFSMRSLDAFDDLMNIGVAIEFDSNSSNDNSSATPITSGTYVQFMCTAMTWNGSSAESFIFAESQLKFVVGRCHVSRGMDVALLRLKEGDTANVICSPNKAYGEQGLPPVVPPNSNIVYRISELSVLAKIQSGDKSAEAKCEISVPEEFVAVPTF